MEDTLDRKNVAFAVAQVTVKTGWLVENKRGRMSGLSTLGLYSNTRLNSSSCIVSLIYFALLKSLISVSNTYKGIQACSEAHSLTGGSNKLLRG